MLLERAVSRLQLAAHSAEALKGGLDSLEAAEIANHNIEAVLHRLESSTAPFARLLELSLSCRWSVPVIGRRES